MRNVFPLLCCLSLLFLSCSDSTGPGNTGDGEIIAHETIGAEGGSAGSDAVGIEIPAGAFDGDASVALTTAPEQSFEDDAASETYVITGLPQSYSKELTVSLAVTGDLTEESYIAVGVNTWISSLGEMTTSYTMLPATVDGDTLTALLPATGLAIGKMAAADAEETTSITVTAVTGYKPHVTAGGHFKIEYATRFTTLASVQQLGVYLEEAYTTIAGLGFSYAGRTNWPVSVTVKNLGKEVYGFSSNSLWGDNHGYLEFNSQKMSEFAEMRTTAGHEFFHLVQSLYDSRNFYSKAKYASPQLWLNEATAVWVEEKFTDQKDYVSSARAGNNLAPFKGVIAGAANDAGKHGYGLSAMIKYLVGEHGESCLLEMYEALKNGTSPMAAVMQGTADPLEWWEEFLAKYTLGEFYNVSIAELTANKSGMYQIIFDSDTLATFTGDYPDLSGKLYVIRLENTYFDDNAKLSLSIEGGVGTVTAFKYRINPLGIEQLYTDPEKVMVSDLKSLERDGWHIIALVSNSRSITPYTENSTIDLTVRVTSPIDPGFTYFFLNPQMIGDFESTISSNYTSLFCPSYSPAGPGTLTGTTFTGTRNEPWQDGTIVGNYTITFDDTFQNILTISATQSMTKPLTGGTGTSFQHVTFTAHDIPLASAQDGSYLYRLTGDEITDQVSGYTFEYGFNNDPSLDDRLTRLIGYRGGGGSDIYVRIWKK